MTISVTLRGGSGDMTKTVYDPDLDGLIALAQLKDVHFLRSLAEEKVLDVADVDIYDSGVADDYVDNVGTSWIDTGVPYTVLKADMGANKSFNFKATIGCEVKGEGGGCTGYAGYTINGGAVQTIGNDGGSGNWSVVTDTLVNLKEGDVIQWKKKASGAVCGAGTKERTVTLTHNIYYELYTGKSDVDDY